MEFVFENSEWLNSLISDNGFLLSILIFGPICSLLPLGLARWLLKQIGLRFIADWRVLDSLMVALLVSTFLNLIVLLPLFFALDQNPGTGVRLLLIALLLFVSVFVIFTLHAQTLMQWVDSVNGTKKESLEKK